MKASFFELTPVDTLFFRGSQPMEAGQLSQRAMFPPPVSVFVGALRTAVLREKDVSFAAYNRGENVPQEVLEAVGQSGAPAPFSVVAVLLKKDGVVYAPAPFGWFVDRPDRPNEGGDWSGKTVLRAAICGDDLAKSLGINASSKTPPLVSVKDEAQTLGGTWIRWETLGRTGDWKLEPGDLRMPGELYAEEYRTGISLLDEQGNPTRNVQTGKLFSATHVRLKEGVSLVVGIAGNSKEWRGLGLGERGSLELGGERRICGYETCSLEMPNVSGATHYVALAPVAVPTDDKKILPAVLCSGKLQRTAGWDLHKKFHKETISWLPAGTVFQSNINGQCLVIGR